MTQPQLCQHRYGLLKSNFNLHFFEAMKVNMFSCLGYLQLLFSEFALPAIDYVPQPQIHTLET